MVSSFSAFVRAYAVHAGLFVAGMAIVAAPAGAYILHERAQARQTQQALVASAVVVAPTSTPAQIVVQVSTTTSVSVVTGVSFDGAGEVKSVSVSSGKSVASGEALFTIDRTDLSAQLAAAKKALSAAQAALAKAASTTAPVSVADQSALTQAQNSVRTAVRNAYISASDVVTNKATQFFTNANNPSISLSFPVTNSQLGINVASGMQSISATFAAWEKQVYASSFNTATDTAALASQAESNLKPVPSFLTSLSTAVNEGITLSGSQKSSDQSTLSNAQLTISNALSAVVAAETDETEARAQITADSKAGNTALVQNDQAAVAAAQAQVNAIESEMTEVVKAPVAGVVTVKVKDGQAVSTSTVLATVSSKK